MKARLILTFDDSSHHQIVVDKAVEIDTSGKREISFRETGKGSWVMAFTKSLTRGKKLADNFLTVTKEGS